MSRNALTQCWTGAVGVALFVLAGNTHPAFAQIPASWNAFSVDIGVKSYEVTADGTPTEQKPLVTKYRLERIAAPGTWRTITTFLEGTTHTIKTPLGTTTLDPFLIRRMEDDGDGSPLRLYDKEGKQIRIPRLPTQLVTGSAEALLKRNPDVPAELLKESPRPAHAHPGREWIHALIAAPGGKTERQNNLFARFGGRVGTTQSLDRYAVMNGDERVDVLVDPSTAVIVAVDTSRNGVLIAHTTLTYRTGSRGELIRAGNRSEQLAQNGRRTVSEVTFSNMTFDKVEWR